MTYLKYYSNERFQSRTYISQGYYKSFQPNELNKQWFLVNMEIKQLLSQADRQMGRLDLYSEYIPNIDMFISIQGSYTEQ